MEGANHDFLSTFANELARTLSHLTGRFVGKRDGRNALGLKAQVNQFANFLRDHARLARASAGQHKAGAFDVIDSFKLSWIQTSGGGGHA
jgi:hypothetical protein